MKDKLFVLFTTILFYTSYNLTGQTFEWAKKTVNLDINLVPSDINKSCVDASGNVYAAGRFQGVNDFDPNSGVYNLTSIGFYDAYVTKMDTNGNFVWAKQWGSSGYTSCNSITTDQFGNVFTLGTFSGTVDFNPNAGVFSMTALGNNDIFICKLDSNGDFIWAKKLGGADFYSEIPSSIVVDATGNVYTTGTFNATADFDPGNAVYNLSNELGYDDIFVSKLNSNGDFIWAKQIKGSNACSSSSIVINENGCLYISGIFEGTIDFEPYSGINSLVSIGTNFNSFITKLSPNGDFIWAKEIKAPSCFIAQDFFGNVYATGLFIGTTDFDPNSGVFNLTSIVGDGYMLKLNDAGNFVWAKQFGGTNPVYCSSICISSYETNAVYLSGYFYDTVDFDPNSGSNNVTSIGQADVFIAKLDSQGNLVFAKGIGGLYDEVRASISLDSFGSIYTTGSFEGECDFDPNQGTFNINSGAIFNDTIFIQKMSQQQLGSILDENGLTNLLIYPNPSNGNVSINFGQTQEKITVTITNSLGQVVSSKNFSQTQIATYTISGERGIYFITIENENKEKKTVKFIKE